MQFFVGIDVSLESSSICVIDERGIIIKEGKVESDPQSVAKFIRHKGRKIEHVGLEAGQRRAEPILAGMSGTCRPMPVLPRANEARLHHCAFRRVS